MKDATDEVVWHLRFVRILMLFIALTVCPAAIAFSTEHQNFRSGEEINWQVISAGGEVNGISANYALGSTAAQTAIGRGISTNYGLIHGFWQNFSGPCDCIPGDANGDGSINVGDAVKIINFVFKGGDPPTPYAICSGDANHDCLCNAGDSVYLINYVFKGGSAPVDCNTWESTCGQPVKQ